MPRSLPVYLIKHRKCWALSLRELGFLLGVGTTTIYNYETNFRRPSRELLVAAEVVFGEGTREVFPAFYEDVEEKVMARAQQLYATLEGKGDARSLRKLKLLHEIVGRSRSNLLDL